ncbi:MAG: transcription antitermination factor NusB [Actinobacteria bacterium]|nr:transcription antitermination factor NusB [Actinomycetota bacterium]
MSPSSSSSSSSSYTGGVGSRREARERILSLLYEAEAKECAVAAVLDALPLKPDPFVDEITRGVGVHQADIDGKLRAHARGWTLERMPATDRAILRMATYELGWCPDVPTAVVISEAVELAKSYSTDDSGRFVNGMLSALAPELRNPREDRGA